MMEIGTRIRTKFGPYETVAEVIEVNEVGAVLSLAPTATLVGFDSLTYAPNGTQLTEDKMHTFLGRAHFASADIIPTRRKKVQ